MEKAYSRTEWADRRTEYHWNVDILFHTRFPWYYCHFSVCILQNDISGLGIAEEIELRAFRLAISGSIVIATHYVDVFHQFTEIWEHFHGQCNVGQRAYGDQSNLFGMLKTKRTFWFFGWSWTVDWSALPLSPCDTSNWPHSPMKRDSSRLPWGIQRRRTRSFRGTNFS